MNHRLKFNKIILLTSLAVSLGSNACTIVSHRPDVPPDQIESYKKAMSKYVDKSRISGTKEYSDKLFEISETIYIGKVSSILTDENKTPENIKLDSDYAYITISKGWKKGKQKHISVKAPTSLSTCPNLYSYHLEVNKTYLFYENHKELITAIPVFEEASPEHTSQKNIVFLGEYDWYYSRSSEIQYTKKLTFR